MDELGQRSRRSLRPPTGEAGQAGEHGVRFLEADVRDLPAVASMPAERGSPELRGREVAAGAGSLGTGGARRSSGSSERGVDSVGLSAVGAVTGS